MPTNASKSALRVLMAELARAHQALERGALDRARQSIEAALAIDPQNVRALQLREQVEHAAAAPAADVPRPPSSPAAARERPAAWSAFEKRVRDRRAERCVLAAREALSRGDVAAAKAVTDELALLVPEHPALAELRTLAPSGAEEVRPAAPPAAMPPSVPAVAQTRLAAPPPSAQPSAPAPAPERATRPLRPPVTSQEPLHRRQDPPDLNAFTSERTLERQRSVPSVPEPSRRRPQAAVLAAAAAVLLVGVLLPLEWGRRADPPDSVAERDAPAESMASVGSAADPDPVTETEGESVTPAEPQVLPEQLNAEAAPQPVSPGPGESDEEAVKTSGASEAPEDTQPVETTARNVERGRPPAIERPAPAPTVSTARAEDTREDEAEAQRTAYAARELARAEAAQRAMLLRPERVAAAPPPAPPEPERAEPAETGTLARLGTTESASLRTPPGAGVPQVSPPSAYVPSPASRPAETPAVAVEPPRDTAVRDVLQRYVTAYNRLDAVAAREVWPTVDQSALERAFAQLDSQMLRFDRCDVDVDDEGGIATCAGQARWVPRVGTRDPKREARTWRFELARNGDDWIITRAEARR